MLQWLFSLIRSLFGRFFRYLGITSSPKPSENTLKVQIKTTTGISFLIELNPKWDIAQIKKIVAPEVALTTDQISIIFAGKDLADNLLLEVHFSIPYQFNSVLQLIPVNLILNNVLNEMCVVFFRNVILDSTAFYTQ